MRRFNIVEPRSIEDACKILAEDEDVKLISGGTALLILIKHGILLPKTLVNLKKIQDATEITYDPDERAQDRRLGKYLRCRERAGGASALSVAGASLSRGGEHPHPQHGNHRRKPGACRFAIRSARRAGRLGCQRGADQTGRSANRQARGFFSSAVTRRVWSATKYSRPCGCRRRRQMPEPLISSSPRVLRKTALRRHCGVGARDQMAVSQKRAL